MRVGYVSIAPDMRHELRGQDTHDLVRNEPVVAHGRQLGESGKCSRRISRCLHHCAIA